MGYHDEIEGSGMGRDKQVVMADGLADVMQMGVDFRVMMVNRFLPETKFSWRIKFFPVEG